MMVHVQECDLVVVLAQDHPNGIQKLEDLAHVEDPDYVGHSCVAIADGITKDLVSQQSMLRDNCVGHVHTDAQNAQVVQAQEEANTQSGSPTHKRFSAHDEADVSQNSTPCEPRVHGRPFRCVENLEAFKKPSAILRGQDCAYKCVHCVLHIAARQNKLTDGIHDNWNLSGETNTNCKQAEPEPNNED